MGQVSYSGRKSPSYKSWPWIFKEFQDIVSDITDTQFFTNLKDNANVLTKFFILSDTYGEKFPFETRWRNLWPRR